MTSIATLYKKAETRGEISNVKKYLVPVERLFIEDGFNVRELDMNHVEAIAAAYVRGDYLPPIVVEVQGDDETAPMKVVDGHHRFTAIKLLIDQGKDFKRIQCESFNGSAAEQVKFMIASSQGRNLSAMERAQAYRRLTIFGWTTQEIAKNLARSITDVENHLYLVEELLPEVQAMIQNGEIAYNIAIKLHRQGGSGAIIKAVEKSKKDGAKKVTMKHTSLYKNSIGKNVVRMLGRYDAVQTDDGIQVTLSPEDWAEIQEAVQALKSTGNEE